MKNKIIAIIISYCLFEQALFGACPSNVTLLEEGEKTPCRGFLFSPETAQRATKADVQYKLLLEEYELINKQLILYKDNYKLQTELFSKEQEKVLIWKDRAENYAVKYNELQDKRQTKDWLFFSLGVIVTIGAGFAIGQAGRK